MVDRHHPETQAHPTRGRAGGILLILVGVALILGFGFDWAAIFPGGSPDDLPAAPQTGARAPDFDLQDVQGNQARLSDFRGTPVMINFWATWCSPCRIEMPSIQARYDQHRPGLVVLAVNFDEPVELVRTFVDEFGLTFPVLLDPGAVVQDAYEIRGYPTSFFLDEDGVIRAVHVGILSEEQLDGYLRQLGVQ